MYELADQAVAMTGRAPDAAVSPLDAGPMANFWMPFTDNRYFKNNPRLLERAKGMHYYTREGRRLLDATAGLWCDDPQRSALTGQLNRLGVRRITRPGRMQRPLWLRDHDGRPRISDWVDWTDVEP